MYEELKNMIEESNSIVFFGGAGVSTESGIPDFRSEKGLYNAKQEYGRSPEEMLSAHFFEQDPVTFFDYYKKNLIANVVTGIIDVRDIEIPEYEFADEESDSGEVVEEETDE